MRKRKGCKRVLKDLPVEGEVVSGREGARRQGNGKRLSKKSGVGEVCDEQKEWVSTRNL